MELGLSAVMFDAVIFDLDGTLADTLEDIADAMNRVLRGRAVPRPRLQRLPADDRQRAGQPGP